LDNLEFHGETGGYVAGVTNPMFKNKTDFFDACCEVDVGKMRMASSKSNYYNYQDEKYYQLDCEFFQTLVYRIKVTHDLSD